MFFCATHHFDLLNLAANNLAEKSMA